MSEILDTVTTYLKSMHLSYEIKPVKGEIDRIVVPYEVPEQKLQFDVVIDVSGNFVRFWTLVMLHDKIRSKKKREELFLELLQANGHLAEIKYFITERGDVGLVGHEGINVLTIDGFRDEFRAIPYGIVYFTTVIAKKMNLSLSLPSTEELSFYM
jgi:hypothetical protein